MDSNYAVIQVNNRQYIVKNGDSLKIDRVSVDVPVTVLLANIDEKLIIGKPVAQNVGVKLEITNQVKDKKINVSRFRNKSRYRRNKGFRQSVTYIKVIEIDNSGKIAITESKDLIKNNTVVDEKPILPAKDLQVKSTEKKDDLRKVSDLDLSDRVIQDLNKAGYKTVEDLKKAKREDLGNIKGFGDKVVDKIFDQIS